MIISPPKIYLDTAHVANIYNLRAGRTLPHGGHEDAYAYIDECVKNGLVGLVFSPSAAVEWVDGKATEASARELAVIFDSATLLYYAAMDVFIYLREVLDDVCRQKPGLVVPRYSILQPRQTDGVFRPAIACVINACPTYQDRFASGGMLPVTMLAEAMPFPSVAQYAAEAHRFRKSAEDIHQGRVIGYEASLKEDLRHRHLATRQRGKPMVGWLNRFLGAEIVIGACNPGIESHALLSAVDLIRCPAVRLFDLARRLRIRQGHDPKPNEGDDFAFLAVVPYCDLVLTDHEHRSRIQDADREQTRHVHSHPAKFVEALRRLLAPPTSSP